MSTFISKPRLDFLSCSSTDSRLRFALPHFHQRCFHFHSLRPGARATFTFRFRANWRKMLRSMSNPFVSTLNSLYRRYATTPDCCSTGVCLRSVGSNGECHVFRSVLYPAAKRFGTFPSANLSGFSMTLSHCRQLRSSLKLPAGPFFTTSTYYARN